MSKEVKETNGVVIKLSKLIEALEITKNKVGDLEVLYGLPIENEELIKMKFDLPDFYVMDGNVVVLTGMSIVDKMIKQQEQEKVEDIKQSFIDENGNKIK